MPPFYIWPRLLMHIPGELNISNQSWKLYWFIVLQKDQGVRFHLCLWGPSWAPAVLGSGGLLSRQKTQWPTLQDSPKQPLTTASKTKPLTEITRRRWTWGIDRCPLWSKSHTQKSDKSHVSCPLWYFPLWNFTLKSGKCSVWRGNPERGISSVATRLVQVI